MEPAIGWFISLAALSTLGLSVGCWVGRGRSQRAWLALAMALVVLVVWVWLQRHPAVAINAIPTSVLRYLEGTLAAPLYMLVIGIAWSRSRLPRQRRVTMLAMALGTIYFLQGALWMVQTTPSAALGQTVQPDGLVKQSQDFSCVPAACATALNLLGVPTTEAQMAELTDTRPGTGATMIRAVEGLRRRLEPTPWRPVLLAPKLEDLRELPMPMITPLQFESTRRHMVAVLGPTPLGLHLADPALGELVMSLDELRDHFTGQVIVFVKK